MIATLFFIIGAVYGSFLNMLLWRLPRDQGLGGRSRCPLCQAQLAWHNLIPIFSFIFLLGRCRTCRARIPNRYLLVEIVSAATLGLFGFFVVPVLTIVPMIFGVCIAFTLLVLLFFDLYYFILPDMVVIPAILIVMLYAIFVGANPVQHLVTALISGLFFGILYVVSKGRWLGFGDVKLAILLGLIFGYPLSYLIILASVWVGAITGLVMIALGKATMKKALPFGAFLCSVALIVLIFYDKLTYIEIFFR